MGVSPSPRPPATIASAAPAPIPRGRSKAHRVLRTTPAIKAAARRRMTVMAEMVPPPARSVQSAYARRVSGTDTSASVPEQTKRNGGHDKQRERDFRRDVDRRGRQHEHDYGDDREQSNGGDDPRLAGAHSAILRPRAPFGRDSRNGASGRARNRWRRAKRVAAAFAMSASAGQGGRGERAQRVSPRDRSERPSASESACRGVRGAKPLG